MIYDRNYRITGQMHPLDEQRLLLNFLVEMLDSGNLAFDDFCRVVDSGADCIGAAGDLHPSDRSTAAVFKLAVHQMKARLSENHPDLAEQFAALKNRGDLGL